MARRTARTALLSRYSLQQSMFAPLSRLGSARFTERDQRTAAREGPDQLSAPASIEMTLRMTFSTLCTGLQRSEACSYIVGSSPGVCRIEMQTVPSG